MNFENTAVFLKALSRTGRLTRSLWQSRGKLGMPAVSTPLGQLIFTHRHDECISLKTLPLLIAALSEWAGEEVVDYLAEQLQSIFPDIQNAAVEALTNIGGVKASEVLLSVEDPQLKRWALDGIFQLVLEGMNNWDQTGAIPEYYNVPPHLAKRLLNTLTGLPPEIVAALQRKAV